MFDKLKKALGFGPANDNDELITDDPELHTPDSSPFALNGSVQVQVETTGLDETVTEVFNQVIVQFNKALPGFLKDSVDPEREKQQLFNALSEDVKAHLRALERGVTDRLDQAWRTERDKLQSDLRNISETAKDLEAKRAELKQQQLSSERQKRALTDRVKDLEKQILTFEAEKEQLELENKSMLNKVKVAQVYEKDLEALREQVAQKGSIDPNPELLEQIETLKAEKDELIERVTALTEIEEQYNAMIERMEVVEEKMAEFDEMTANKDARLASMKDQLTVAKETITEKSKKLDDLTAEMERLRKERNAAVEQVKAYERAATKAEGDGTPVAQPRISMPDSDDILNDTDWIVQPAGNNRRKPTDSRHDRPSRPKKSTPRDDGQMSLW